MEQNRRKILYHYTDFQAADGILRSAQLRVNNVLNMNDSAEMRHFMTRLSSAITGRLRGEGFAAQADQLQNLFSQELRKEYSAFAACFSFHRDDAAQWERYGNRGRGVCFTGTTWPATPWWTCSVSWPGGAGRWTGTTPP